MMNVHPENIGSRSDSPLSELLQREIVKMNGETGTSEVHFVIPELFLNRQGILHGGIIAAMLDTACGVAIRARADAKIHPGQATLELKTSFLRPGQPGQFVAHGMVRRLGKSIAFAEAELFDADNEMVARASATFKMRVQK